MNTYQKKGNHCASEQKARCDASLLRELHEEETGLATAEYGIVMLAAVGFAGLLVAVLSSGEVQGLLRGIVERALSF